MKHRFAKESLTVLVNVDKSPNVSADVTECFGEGQAARPDDNSRAVTVIQLE